MAENTSGSGASSDNYAVQFTAEANLQVNPNVASGGIKEFNAIIENAETSAAKLSSMLDGIKGKVKPFKDATESINTAIERYNKAMNTATTAKGGKNNYDKFFNEFDKHSNKVVEAFKKKIEDQIGAIPGMVEKIVMGAAKQMEDSAFSGSPVGKLFKNKGNAPAAPAAAKPPPAAPSGTARSPHSWMDAESTAFFNKFNAMVGKHAIPDIGRNLRSSQTRKQTPATSYSPVSNVDQRPAIRSSSRGRASARSEDPVGAFMGNWKDSGVSEASRSLISKKLQAEINKVRKSTSGKEISFGFNAQLPQTKTRQQVLIDLQKNNSGYKIQYGKDAMKNEMSAFFGMLHEAGHIIREAKGSINEKSHKFNAQSARINEMSSSFYALSKIGKMFPKIKDDKSAMEGLRDIVGKTFFNGKSGKLSETLIQKMFENARSQRGVLENLQSFIKNSMGAKSGTVEKSIASSLSRELMGGVASQKSFMVKFAEVLADIPLPGRKSRNLTTSHVSSDIASNAAARMPGQATSAGRKINYRTATTREEVFNRINRHADVAKIRATEIPAGGIKSLMGTPEGLKRLILSRMENAINRQLGLDFTENSKNRSQEASVLRDMRKTDKKAARARVSENRNNPLLAKPDAQSQGNGEIFVRGPMITRYRKIISSIANEDNVETLRSKLKSVTGREYKGFRSRSEINTGVNLSDFSEERIQELNAATRKPKSKDSRRLNRVLKTMDEGKNAVETFKNLPDAVRDEIYGEFSKMMPKLWKSGPKHGMYEDPSTRKAIRDVITKVLAKNELKPFPGPAVYPEREIDSIADHMMQRYRSKVGKTQYGMTEAPGRGSFAINRARMEAKNPAIMEAIIQGNMKGVYDPKTRKLVQPGLRHLAPDIKLSPNTVKKIWQRATPVNTDEERVKAVANLEKLGIDNREAQGAIISANNAFAAFNKLAGDRSVGRTAMNLIRSNIVKLSDFGNVGNLQKNLINLFGDEKLAAKLAGNQNFRNFQSQLPMLNLGDMSYRTMATSAAPKVVVPSAGTAPSAGKTGGNSRSKVEQRLEDAWRRHKPEEPMPDSIKGLLGRRKHMERNASIIIASLGEKFSRPATLDDMARSKEDGVALDEQLMDLDKIIPQYSKPITKWGTLANPERAKDVAKERYDSILKNLKRQLAGKAKHVEFLNKQALEGKQDPFAEKESTFKKATEASSAKAVKRQVISSSPLEDMGTDTQPVPELGNSEALSMTAMDFIKNKMVMQGADSMNAHGKMAETRSGLGDTYENIVKADTSMRILARVGSDKDIFKTHLADKNSKKLTVNPAFKELLETEPRLENNTAVIPEEAGILPDETVSARLHDKLSEMKDSLKKKRNASAEEKALLSEIEQVFKNIADVRKESEKSVRHTMTPLALMQGAGAPFQVFGESARSVVRNVRGNNVAHSGISGDLPAPIDKRGFMMLINDAKTMISENIYGGGMDNKMGNLEKNQKFISRNKSTTDEISQGIYNALATGREGKTADAGLVKFVSMVSAGLPLSDKLLNDAGGFRAEVEKQYAEAGPESDTGKTIKHVIDYMDSQQKRLGGIIKAQKDFVARTKSVKKDSRVYKHLDNLSKSAETSGNTIFSGGLNDVFGSKGFNQTLPKSENIGHLNSFIKKSKQEESEILDYLEKNKEVHARPAMTQEVLELEKEIPYQEAKLKLMQEAFNKSKPSRNGMYSTIMNNEPVNFDERNLNETKLAISEMKDIVAKYKGAPVSEDEGNKKYAKYEEMKKKAAVLKYRIHNAVQMREGISSDKDVSGNVNALSREFDETALIDKMLASAGVKDTSRKGIVNAIKKNLDSYRTDTASADSGSLRNNEVPTNRDMLKSLESHRGKVAAFPSEWKNRQAEFEKLNTDKTTGKPTMKLPNINVDRYLQYLDDMMIIARYFDHQQVDMKRLSEAMNKVSASGELKLSGSKRLTKDERNFFGAFNMAPEELATATPQTISKKSREIAQKQAAERVARAEAEKEALSGHGRVQFQLGDLFDSGFGKIQYDISTGRRSVKDGVPEGAGGSGGDSDITRRAKSSKTEGAQHTEPLVLDYTRLDGKTPWEGDEGAAPNRYVTKPDGTKVENQKWIENRIKKEKLAIEEASRRRIMNMMFASRNADEKRIGTDLSEKEKGVISAHEESFQKLHSFEINPEAPAVSPAEIKKVYDERYREKIAILSKPSMMSGKRSEPETAPEDGRLSGTVIQPKMSQPQTAPAGVPVDPALHNAHVEDKARLTPASVIAQQANVENLMSSGNIIEIMKGMAAGVLLEMDKMVKIHTSAMNDIYKTHAAAMLAILELNGASSGDRTLTASGSGKRGKGKSKKNENREMTPDEVKQLMSDIISGKTSLKPESETKETVRKTEGSIRSAGKSRIGIRKFNTEEMTQRLNEAVDIHLEKAYRRIATEANTIRKLTAEMSIAPPERRAEILSRLDDFITKTRLNTTEQLKVQTGEMINKKTGKPILAVPPHKQPHESYGTISTHSTVAEVTPASLEKMPREDEMSRAKRLLMVLDTMTQSEKQRLSNRKAIVASMSEEAGIAEKLSSVKGDKKLSKIASLVTTDNAERISTAAKSVILKSTKENADAGLPTHALNFNVRPGDMNAAQSREEKILSDAAKAEAAGGRLIKGVANRVFLYGGMSFALYGFIFKAKEAIDIMGKFETAIVASTRVMSPILASQNRLGESARKMGQDYGIGIIQTAEAMSVYAQQGKSTSEVIKLTEASLLAQNTTEMDATYATEALTAAMRQFNIEDSKAVGIIDSWNEVENRTAITSRHLADAIKVSGSAAKVAGVTFDELNGMVAAVGSATRQTGNEIGRSFKYIFSHLKTDESAQAINDVGIATTDMNGNFRSAFSVLSELATKWDTYNNAQKTNVAIAVSGTRQYNVMLTLMDEWKAAMDATKMSLDSQGSSMRENDLVMNTYAKTLEKFKASTESLFANLGEGGGKAILKSMVGGAQNLIDVFGKMPKAITSVAATGGLMLAGGAMLAQGIAYSGIPEFMGSRQEKGIHASAVSRAAKAYERQGLKTGGLKMSEYMSNPEATKAITDAAMTDVASRSSKVITDKQQALELQRQVNDSVSEAIGRQRWYYNEIEKTSSAFSKYGKGVSSVAVGLKQMSLLVKEHRLLVTAGGAGAMGLAQTMTDSNSPTGKTVVGDTVEALGSLAFNWAFIGKSAGGVVEKSVALERLFTKMNLSAASWQGWVAKAATALVTVGLSSGSITGAYQHLKEIFTGSERSLRNQLYMESEKMKSLQESLSVYDRITKLQNIGKAISPIDLDNLKQAEEILRRLIPNAEKPGGNPFDRQLDKDVVQKYLGDTGGIGSARQKIQEQYATSMFRQSKSPGGTSEISLISKDMYAEQAKLNKMNFERSVLQKDMDKEKNPVKKAKLQSRYDELGAKVNTSNDILIKKQVDADKFYKPLVEATAGIRASSIYKDIEGIGPVDESRISQSYSEGMKAALKDAFKIMGDKKVYKDVFSENIHTMFKDSQVDIPKDAQNVFNKTDKLFIVLRDTTRKVAKGISALKVEVSEPFTNTVSKLPFTVDSSASSADILKRATEVARQANPKIAENADFVISSPNMVQGSTSRSYHAAKTMMSTSKTANEAVMDAYNNMKTRLSAPAEVGNIAVRDSRDSISESTRRLQMMNDEISNSSTLLGKVSDNFSKIQEEIAGTDGGLSTSIALIKQFYDRSISGEATFSDVMQTYRGNLEHILGMQEQKSKTVSKFMRNRKLESIKDPRQRAELMGDESGAITPVSKLYESINDELKNAGLPDKIENIVAVWDRKGLSDEEVRKELDSLLTVAQSRINNPNLSNLRAPVEKFQAMASSARTTMRGANEEMSSRSANLTVSGSAAEADRLVGDTYKSIMSKLETLVGGMRDQIEPLKADIDRAKNERDDLVDGKRGMRGERLVNQNIEIDKSNSRVKALEEQYTVLNAIMKETVSGIMQVQSPIAVLTEKLNKMSFAVDLQNASLPILEGSFGSLETDLRKLGIAVKLTSDYYKEQIEALKKKNLEPGISQFQIDKNNEDIKYLQERSSSAVGVKNKELKDTQERIKIEQEFRKSEMGKLAAATYVNRLTKDPNALDVQRQMYNPAMDNTRSMLNRVALAMNSKGEKVDVSSRRAFENAARELGSRMSDIRMASDPTYIKNTALASGQERAAASFITTQHMQGRTLDEIFADSGLRELAKTSPLLSDLIDRIAKEEVNPKLTEAGDKFMDAVIKFGDVIDGIAKQLSPANKAFVKEGKELYINGSTRPPNIPNPMGGKPTGTSGGSRSSMVNQMDGTFTGPRGVDNKLIRVAGGERVLSAEEVEYYKSIGVPGFKKGTSDSPLKRGWNLDQYGEDVMPLKLKQEIEKSLTENIDNAVADKDKPARWAVARKTIDNAVKAISPSFEGDVGKINYDISTGRRSQGIDGRYNKGDEGESLRKLPHRLGWLKSVPFVPQWAPAADAILLNPELPGFAGQNKDDFKLIIENFKRIHGEKVAKQENNRALRIAKYDEKVAEGRDLYTARPTGRFFEDGIPKMDVRKIKNPRDNHGLVNYDDMASKNIASTVELYNLAGPDVLRHIKRKNKLPIEFQQLSSSYEKMLAPDSLASPEEMVKAKKAVVDKSGEIESFSARFKKEHLDYDNIGRWDVEDLKLAHPAVLKRPVLLNKLSSDNCTLENYDKKQMANFNALLSGEKNARILDALEDVPADSDVWNKVGNGQLNDYIKTMVDIGVPLDKGVRMAGVFPQSATWLRNKAVENPQDKIAIDFIKNAIRSHGRLTEPDPEYDDAKLLRFLPNDIERFKKYVGGGGYDEFLKLKKGNRIPDIDFETKAGLRVRLLNKGSAETLQAGVNSGCCQHPLGAAKKSAWYALENPLSGVYAIESAKGGMMAQSMAWINPEYPNSIVLDSSEGFKLDTGDKSNPITEAYRELVTRLKGDFGLNVHAGSQHIEGNVAVNFPEMISGRSRETQDKLLERKYKAQIERINSKAYGERKLSIPMMIDDARGEVRHPNGMETIPQPSTEMYPYDSKKQRLVAGTKDSSREISDYIDNIITASSAVENPLVRPSFKRSSGRTAVIPDYMVSLDEMRFLGRATIATPSIHEGLEDGRPSSLEWLSDNYPGESIGPITDAHTESFLGRRLVRKPKPSAREFNNAMAEFMELRDKTFGKDSLIAPITQVVDEFEGITYQPVDRNPFSHKKGDRSNVMRDLRLQSEIIKLIGGAETKIPVQPFWNTVSGEESRQKANEMVWRGLLSGKVGGGLGNIWREMTGDFGNTAQNIDYDPGIMIEDAVVKLRELEMSKQAKSRISDVLLKSGTYPQGLPELPKNMIEDFVNFQALADSESASRKQSIARQNRYIKARMTLEKLRTHPALVGSSHILGTELPLINQMATNIGMGIKPEDDSKYKFMRENRRGVINLVNSAAKDGFKSPQAYSSHEFRNHPDNTTPIAADMQEIRYGFHDSFHGDSDYDIAERSNYHMNMGTVVDEMDKYEREKYFGADRLPDGRYVENNTCEQIRVLRELREAYVSELGINELPSIRKKRIAFIKSDYNNVPLTSRDLTSKALEAMTLRKFSKAYDAKHGGPEPDPTPAWSERTGGFNPARFLKGNNQRYYEVKQNEWKYFIRDYSEYFSGKSEGGTHFDGDMVRWANVNDILDAGIVPDFVSDSGKNNASRGILSREAVSPRFNPGYVERKTEEVLEFRKSPENNRAKEKKIIESIRQKNEDIRNRNNPKDREMIRLRGDGRALMDPVTVYKNPSQSDIDDIIKSQKGIEGWGGDYRKFGTYGGRVRTVYDVDGNSYKWSAAETIHENIMAALEQARPSLRTIEDGKRLIPKLYHEDDVKFDIDARKKIGAVNSSSAKTASNGMSGKQIRDMADSILMRGSKEYGYEANIHGGLKGVNKAYNKLGVKSASGASAFYKHKKKGYKGREGISELHVARPDSENVGVKEALRYLADVEHEEKHARQGHYGIKRLTGKHSANNEIDADLRMLKNLHMAGLGKEAGLTDTATYLGLDGARKVLSSFDGNGRLVADKSVIELLAAKHEKQWASKNKSNGFGTTDPVQSMNAVELLIEQINTTPYEKVEPVKGKSAIAMDTFLKNARLRGTKSSESQFDKRIRIAKKLASRKIGRMTSSVSEKLGSVFNWKNETAQELPFPSKNIPFSSLQRPSGDNTSDILRLLDSKREVKNQSGIKADNTMAAILDRSSASDIIMGGANESSKKAISLWLKNMEWMPDKKVSLPKTLSPTGGSEAMSGLEIPENPLPSRTIVDPGFIDSDFTNMLNLGKGKPSPVISGIKKYAGKTWDYLQGEGLKEQWKNTSFKDILGSKRSLGLSDSTITRGAGGLLAASQMGMGLYHTINIKDTLKDMDISRAMYDDNVKAGAKEEELAAQRFNSASYVRAVSKPVGEIGLGAAFTASTLSKNPKMHSFANKALYAKLAIDLGMATADAFGDKAEYGKFGWGKIFDELLYGTLPMAAMLPEVWKGVNALGTRVNMPKLAGVGKLGFKASGPLMQAEIVAGASEYGMKGGSWLARKAGMNNVADFMEYGGETAGAFISPTRLAFTGAALLSGKKRGEMGDRWAETYNMLNDGNDRSAWNPVDWLNKWEATRQTVVGREGQAPAEGAMSGDNIKLLDAIKRRISRISTQEEFNDAAKSVDLNRDIDFKVKGGSTYLNKALQNKLEELRQKEKDALLDKPNELDAYEKWKRIQARGVRMEQSPSIDDLFSHKAPDNSRLTGAGDKFMDAVSAFTPIMSIPNISTPVNASAGTSPVRPGGRMFGMNEYDFMALPGEDRTEYMKKVYADRGWGEYNPGYMTLPSYKKGGDTKRGGLAVLHPNEYVLSAETIKENRELFEILKKRQENPGASRPRFNPATYERAYVQPPPDRRSYPPKGSIYAKPDMDSYDPRVGFVQSEEARAYDAARVTRSSIPYSSTPPADNRVYGSVSMTSPARTAVSENRLQSVPESARREAAPVSNIAPSVDVPAVVPVVVPATVPSAPLVQTGSRKPYNPDASPYSKANRDAAAKKAEMEELERMKANLPSGNLTPAPVPVPAMQDTRNNFDSDEFRAAYGRQVARQQERERNKPVDKSTVKDMALRGIGTVNPVATGTSEDGFMTKIISSPTWERDSAHAYLEGDLENQLKESHGGPVMRVEGHADGNKKIYTANGLTVNPAEYEIPSDFTGDKNDFMRKNNPLVKSIIENAKLFPEGQTPGLSIGSCNKYGLNNYESINNLADATGVDFPFAAYAPGFTYAYNDLKLPRFDRSGKPLETKDAYNAMHMYKRTYGEDVKSGVSGQMETGDLTDDYARSRNEKTIKQVAGIVEMAAKGESVEDKARNEGFASNDYGYGSYGELQSAIDAAKKNKLGDKYDNSWNLAKYNAETDFLGHMPSRAEYGIMNGITGENLNLTEKYHGFRKSMGQEESLQQMNPEEAERMKSMINSGDVYGNINPRFNDAYSSRFNLNGNSSEFEKEYDRMYGNEVDKFQESREVASGGSNASSMEHHGKIIASLDGDELLGKISEMLNRDMRRGGQGELVEGQQIRRTGRAA